MAGHVDTVTVWSEDGSGPVRLPGHVPSGSGSSWAAWASNTVLVTGLCCGLGDRAHDWLLPGGERLRTIEFGSPTWWQVEAGRLFAEVRRRHHTVCRRRGGCRPMGPGHGCQPAGDPPQPGLLTTVRLSLDRRTGIVGTSSIDAEHPGVPLFRRSGKCRSSSPKPAVPLVGRGQVRARRGGERAPVSRDHRRPASVSWGCHPGGLDVYRLDTPTREAPPPARFLHAGAKRLRGKGS